VLKQTYLITANVFTQDDRMAETGLKSLFRPFIFGHEKTCRKSGRL
jgi:hypothetical protein